MAKSEQQKLAELLGLEAPSEEDGIETDRVLEATLAYLQAPQMFTRQQCLRCDKTFKVNRRNVGYCSRTCRMQALEDWGFPMAYWSDPKGADDRQWVKRMHQGNEPLVVPPGALVAADELLASSEQSPDVSDQVVATVEQSGELLAETVSSGLDALLSFDLSNSDF